MLAGMGAMDEEVALLRERLDVSSEAEHAGIRVSLGNYGGTEIALVKCGIGKVNAAICTQMLIDLYHPDRLVFSGVAGGSSRRRARRRISASSSKPRRRREPAGGSSG